MKVVRIINNNAILIEDNQKKELIAMGGGLGFNYKVGEYVDSSQIEKLFILRDEKLSKYEKTIQRTPLIYFKLAEKIYERANRLSKSNLSTLLILALADHLYFAVDRCKKGDVMPNMMFNEIEMLYPEELKIGEYGRKLVNLNLKVELPIDEAGYIALHIVNNMIDENANTANNTILLTGKILEIIEKRHHIKVERKSFDFSRFLSHIKFLANRIFSGKQINEVDMSDMYELLMRKNKNLEKTIEEIKKFIEEIFEYSLSENECVYLTIHILRVIE